MEELSVGAAQAADAGGDGEGARMGSERSRRSQQRAASAAKHRCLAKTNLPSVRRLPSLGLRTGSARRGRRQRRKRSSLLLPRPLLPPLLPRLRRRALLTSRG